MELVQPTIDLDTSAPKAKPCGAPAIRRLQGIVAALLSADIAALAVIIVCGVYADVGDVWAAVVPQLLLLLSALVTLYLFWSMREALFRGGGVPHASETLKFPILVLSAIFSYMVLSISVAPFSFDTTLVFTALAAATATATTAAAAVAAVPLLFLLFQFLLLLFLRCVVKGPDGLRGGQMPSVIKRESLRLDWRSLLMALSYILSCTMLRVPLTTAFAPPLI